MTDNLESTTYNTEPVLRSEFLKFKDEILSLISQKETALYNKIDTYKEEMGSTEKRYESKVNHIDEQYTNFINVSSSINHRLDKLNTYEATTQRINDQLVSHEIRITNISKDFTKAIQKYDKIFLDNLVLPGYIGEFCKYKNTKEFFDDTIKQIGLLNNFKEKNILDLKKYKERLETIIKNFNLQVDNNSKANMKYVNEIKDKTESNFKEKFEEIKETIYEMKLENSKYAIELKAKSMNLSKEWDKMMKIREEIYEKFDDKVNSMTKSNDNTVHSFNELQEEFSKIKKKFGELAEFIRDVRFRKNIGGDVNKREIKQLINKISFKGKNNYDDNKEFGNARHHSPKIESRIKKYIKGESSIPEATIMRRKRHSVTGKVLSSELNAMKNIYKHYTGDEDVVTNNKNKEEINSESSEGNENNNEIVLSTGIKDNNNNGRYESEVISNEKVIHELSAELEQSAHKMDKFKSPEINVNVTENNNTKKNEDNTNINTNNNNSNTNNNISNINTNNNIKKNEDNTNIITNNNSNINNNSNTKKNEENNNVNINNSNNSKVTPLNNTFVNKFNMTMNGNFKGNDGFINVFDIRKGQKDLDKKISNYNKKLIELEIYTKQKLIELANYFDQRNFTTNPQSKMVNILFSKEQSELNSFSTNSNNNNINNPTGNTSNNYSVNKINLINHVPLTEQPNSAYQQKIPIRNRNNTGIIFNPSLKTINKPFVTTRIKITNQNGNKISGLQVQEETKNIKKRSSIDCENGFQGRGFTGLHHNYSSSDIRRVPVRAVLTDQQKDKGSIANLKKGNEINLLNQ